METKKSKNEIMEKILAVRYSDLELEKSLCLDLLKIATDEEDSYGIAFAHTYLADYYVSENDVKEVSVHLAQAKTLVETIEGCDELELRIYILLGIHYEMLTDEQSTIKSYLRAMTFAEKIGDKMAQCIILNNIGIALVRQKNNQVSLEYFQHAYEVFKEEPNMQIRTKLLSNLTDMSLLLGQMDNARKYIIECETGEKDQEIMERFRRKNWCCYYAGLGDSEKAKFWVTQVLEIIDWYKRDRFESFENFNALCDAMLKINHKEYALTFLHLMEESCSGTLDQLQPLEEKHLKCITTFEPEESHGKAYKRFYEKNEEFRIQVNNTIVNAMQTKMDLEKVNTEKEELQRQHKDLEVQVSLDELTGLYNRRFLDGRMTKWSREIGTTIFGIIMLDVDYFKEYNDFYGHVEGDKVLTVIGACLKENAIEGIYSCRYGGDEFACLCEGITSEEMEEYIVAVRNDLDSRKLLHQESPCNDYVTLSIGYSSQCVHSETEAYLLLQTADQALYHSKLAGRNTYRKR